MCIMNSAGFFVLTVLVSIVGARKLGALTHLWKRDDECDVSAMEECLEPLGNQIDAITGFNPEIDDVTTLNKICNSPVQVNDCFNNSPNTCGIEEYQLAVQSWQGVFTYVCSQEGKDAMLSETGCWDTFNFERHVKDCFDEMEVQLFLSILNEDAVMDQLCQLFDDFRGCATEHVRTTCSDKARNFIDKVLLHALQPLQAELGCEVKVHITRDLMKLFLKTRK